VPASEELERIPSRSGAAGWRAQLHGDGATKCFGNGAELYPFPYFTRRAMSMWREFKAFLLKENVLALAIAVVVGGALNKLVTAVVEDFIMPVVAVATPDPKSWQTAVTPGPIPFKIGDFGSALLNFIIIGFVAWRISKAFIRPAPAAAAPATKPCPYCKMTIDAAASRCAHCTSQL
jgi:large conductance mechanosensitive channel